MIQRDGKRETVVAVFLDWALRPAEEPLKERTV